MLRTILKNYRTYFNSVVPENLQKSPLLLFDFSDNNTDLKKLNIDNTPEFSAFVNYMLLEYNALFGIGGYGEDRMIYRRSKHFGTGKNARDIHLGTDIWGKAYTPVSAPLDGKVHSYKNNDNFGDYGPTIILEHELKTAKFFTLYGHLSLRSVKQIKKKQKIKAGQVFAETGNMYENGHWPPHLHFQIIQDIQKKKGDYPGVCHKTEKNFYLNNCPDPDLILNFKKNPNLIYPDSLQNHKNPEK